MPTCAVYIGWDPREADAFAVARSSMRRRMTSPIPIYGLLLDDLVRQNLHTRPLQQKVNAEGRSEVVDVLSVRADYDGRISTQHANARFLLPFMQKEGLALFTDGDVLVRGNVCEAFRMAQADPSKAVWCVKHDHKPRHLTKMDGQLQTAYQRKNWSSVMLWNLDHEANRKGLTLEMVNTLPGRDLHRLCWLEDDEIGELDWRWNYLVSGVAEPNGDPIIVHFTEGTPSMPGYENVAFAHEWRRERDDWARRG